MRVCPLQETFGTLKDWVKELKMQGPSNILIAVVGATLLTHRHWFRALTIIHGLPGNKADLETKRDVEASMGQAFADEIEGIFAETSAKDTTGGIKELFERIGDRLPALPAQQEAKQGVVAVDKRPQSNAQGAAAGKQSGQCNC